MAACSPADADRPPEGDDDSAQHRGPDEPEIGRCGSLLDPRPIQNQGDVAEVLGADRFDPDWLFSWPDRLASVADGACPTGEGTEDDRTWVGGCTTTSGAQIRGSLRHTRTVDALGVETARLVFDEFIFLHATEDENLDILIEGEGERVTGPSDGRSWSWAFFARGGSSRWLEFGAPPPGYSTRSGWLERYGAEERWARHTHVLEGWAVPGDACVEGRWALAGCDAEGLGEVTIRGQGEAVVRFDPALGCDGCGQAEVGGQAPETVCPAFPSTR